MANLVKCQKCPDKGEKEEMLKVGQKYYHHECYERWKLEKSKVKCAYCNNKDIKNEMIVMKYKASSSVEIDCLGNEKTIEKFVNRYYHSSCSKIVEHNREYKKKLEALVYRLYDIKVLPAWFELAINVIMKEHKVSRKHLFEAYQKATPSIEHSLRSVPFKDLKGQLSYGIAIMKDKLNEVYHEEKQKERSENTMIMAISSHSTSDNNVNDDQTYIFDDDDFDISRFLR